MNNAKTTEKKTYFMILGFRVSQSRWNPHQILAAATSARLFAQNKNEEGLSASIAYVQLLLLTLAQWASGLCSSEMV
jgi:hypothetical protein